MLHFSKIVKNGKEFNLVASGALAFKILNKVLKDETFNGCDISSSSMLPDQTLRKLFANKKVFLAIVSDLDPYHLELLNQHMSRAREQGSYAVCEVICLHYTDVQAKALKQLRKSFNEVVELNKFGSSDNRSLAYTEQQASLFTGFSLSLARMMFQVSVDEYHPYTSENSNVFFKQSA